MSKLWPPVDVPNTPQTPISFEKLMMLQLGENADGVIKCGTSRWNVHLSVLTNRCEWFEQKFFEARSRGSNEVVLSTSPYVAYKIIVWIYTKTLDLHESFRGDIYAMGDCLFLWDMAYQLAIPELMVACEEKLKGFLRGMVVPIQRMKCKGESPTLDAFLICSCVHYVYEKDYSILKNIFLDFVKDSQLWVLDVPDFQKEMATTPEFKKDVASLVKKSPGLRTFKPDVCGQCNKDPFADAEFSHYAYTKSKDGKFTAICFRCHIQNKSRIRTASGAVPEGIAAWLQGVQKEVQSAQKKA
ncbi:hypothetical protein F5Y00DRAFT_262976 [Daldinia vernicosa]|uniref:uncharacterized protein n=1 Tax=Daldinia vernicosa TaxID=114800 RepID=UPI0020082FBC|nr:uncharacterized protein F5Y00DRAFT_262976 [Daldinia vernicosa]KAI0848077.1 hypothetical protein F5Y00DRAFT_262976 [Daldinia vernicosa]